MKLTPPKKSTFWIAVIFAAVGFILYLLTFFAVLKIGLLGLIGVILLAVGFILLALGLTVKGL